jgi:hypothetical protein
MGLLDVIMFSIVIGATFWIIATAWEEYNRKDLSDITLAFVSIGIFFSWIITLSIIDYL